MGEERTPADRGRGGESLSPIVLLRKLDKLQWSVDLLMTDKQERDNEKNDRVTMMRDYKAVKRIAWAILLGFVIIIVGAIASRFSFRVGEAPAPSSPAERLGSDRVPKPDVPTP